jgi:hypothetical protein
MINKNYAKQILELLDSKKNLGSTSREIATNVLIREDKEENLKYIRQYITRLRKRQKIYVQGVNEDNERYYCSVTWLIETFEEIGLKTSQEREIMEAETKGMDNILRLLGYVKKEDPTFEEDPEDLIYDEPVEINDNNYKQIAREKYGIGI